MAINRYPFEETVANLFSNIKYASSYLFYGHLIGQCRIIFDEAMEAPAGVNFELDHYNLFIGPSFNDFTLEQRMGILKHEMLHILNGHMKRKGDRDHQGFNYATDCAINQHIDRRHLPDGCIYPDNFPSKHKIPDGQTAEQYYELLDREYKDGSQSQPGQGKGKVLDDHDKWGESTGDGELQDDITKGMLERAVANTQKSRGDIPSSFSDWLSLFSHKRELDWKKLLQHIVGNKRVGIRKVITRPDRRLPNFEWIKGRTKDRKFDLLVISDVSGSVSDKGLLSLWGEVRHICDITKSAVNLIQVDSRPCKPEELTKHTKSIERKACGGTILHPALKMASDHKIHYDALVITTDGYLDHSDIAKFAKLKVPTIWLIEPDGHIMDEMTHHGMRAFKLKA